MLFILAIDVLFNINPIYLCNKISYKLPLYIPKFPSQCESRVLKSSQFSQPNTFAITIFSTCTVFSDRLYQKATIFCVAQQVCFLIYKLCLTHFSQLQLLFTLTSLALSTSLIKPVMSCVQESHLYSLLAMPKCSKLTYRHSPPHPNICVLLYRVFLGE